MPTWPASLPVSPDADGYTEQGQFPVVQSKPDSGPMLSRARFTADVEPITARYMLDDAQLAIFEAFWKNDLKRGALPFDGPVRGLPGVTATYLATSGYQLTRASEPYWFITLNLVRLP